MAVSVGEGILEENRGLIIGCSVAAVLIAVALAVIIIIVVALVFKHMKKNKSEWCHCFGVVLSSVMLKFKCYHAHMQRPSQILSAKYKLNVVSAIIY